MPFTFDCWTKLLTGTWFERIHSALIILMVFAAASFVISTLLPQDFLANLSFVPALLLTGLLTILKFSN